jgi:hypothetical protein
MKTRMVTLSRLFAIFLYALGGSSLLAGVLLPSVGQAAMAAGNGNPAQPQATPTLACTPPNDWGQTQRIIIPDRPSREWSFEIAEPEMDVTLEFFYYQDYSRDGCPYDCSTDHCQSMETGSGSSPFGSFHIEDGIRQPNSASIRQSGRLNQGSYTAIYRADNQYSLNIGLRVHRRAVATNTPLPLPTNTPTATQPPSPTPTTEPSPTATPTATAVVPGTSVPTASATATATNTPQGQMPSPTSTSTPGQTQPTVVPSETATAEPTEEPSNTPRVPAESPTRTPRPPSPPANPPATLPPPALVTPNVIIPVTGADLVEQRLQLLENLLIKMGLGLIGVGLMVYGIGKRIR